MVESVFGSFQRMVSSINGLLWGNLFSLSLGETVL